MADIRRKGVNVTKENVIGQDGSVVPINEVEFAGDEVILDPNSPLAVQIPEDSGADTSGHVNPLAESLSEDVDVVTPDVHNTPAAQRENATRDIRKESPGAEKKTAPRATDKK